MLGVGLLKWFVANRRGDNGWFGEFIILGYCSGVRKSLPVIKGELNGDFSGSKSGALILLGLCIKRGSSSWCQWNCGKCFGI